jgi:hypothetical protein
VKSILPPKEYHQSHGCGESTRCQRVIITRGPTAQLSCQNVTLILCRHHTPKSFKGLHEPVLYILIACTLTLSRDSYFARPFPHPCQERETQKSEEWQGAEKCAPPQPKISCHHSSCTIFCCCCYCPDAVGQGSLHVQIGASKSRTVWVRVRFLLRKEERKPSPSWAPKHLV